MTEEPHNFAGLLQRVCAGEGWQLTPNGVALELGNGRRQVIAVEAFEFEGQELVRLQTTIGASEGLPAPRLEAALRVNAELAHGALAIRDGDLVMVDTVLLDAKPKKLAGALRYLAETADFYERTLFGTDQH